MFSVHEAASLLSISADRNKRRPIKIIPVLLSRKTPKLLLIMPQIYSPPVWYSFRIALISGFAFVLNIYFSPKLNFFKFTLWHVRTAQHIGMC